MLKTLCVERARQELSDAFIVLCNACMEERGLGWQQVGVVEHCALCRLRHGSMMFGALQFTGHSCSRLWHGCSLLLNAAPIRDGWHAGGAELGGDNPTTMERERMLQHLCRPHTPLRTVTFARTEDQQTPARNEAARGPGTVRAAGVGRSCCPASAQRHQAHGPGRARGRLRASDSRDFRHGQLAAQAVHQWQVLGRLGRWSDMQGSGGPTGAGKCTGHGSRLAQPGRRPPLMRLLPPPLVQTTWRASWRPSWRTARCPSFT